MGDIREGEIMMMYKVNIMGKYATPPQGGRDDTNGGRDMNIYNLSIKGELSTPRLTAITPVVHSLICLLRSVLRSA